MSSSEFNSTAGSVAKNIQKLVQNVSSMQRMLVHVDTQGDSLRYIYIFFVTLKTRNVSFGMLMVNIFFFYFQATASTITTLYR